MTQRRADDACSPSRPGSRPARLIALTGHARRLGAAGRRRVRAGARLLRSPRLARARRRWRSRWPRLPRSWRARSASRASRRSRPRRRSSGRPARVLQQPARRAGAPADAGAVRLRGSPRSGSPGAACGPATCSPAGSGSPCCSSRSPSSTTRCCRRSARVGPPRRRPAAAVLRRAAVGGRARGGQRRVAARAAERERRRIARDLHDGVAQELAFIRRRAARLAGQPDAEDIVGRRRARAARLALGDRAPGARARRAARPRARAPRGGDRRAHGRGRDLLQLGLGAAPARRSARRSRGSSARRSRTRATATPRACTSSCPPTRCACA